MKRYKHSKDPEFVETSPGEWFKNPVYDSPALDHPTKKEIKGGEKFHNHLLEMIDEIGGASFPYDGKLIWIHTPDQVKEWITKELDSWKEDY